MTIDSVDHPIRPATPSPDNQSQYLRYYPSDPLTPPPSPTAHRLILSPIVNNACNQSDLINSDYALTESYDSSQSTLSKNPRICKCIIS